jgi:SAM-dependent methyltransferase
MSDSQQSGIARPVTLEPSEQSRVSFDSPDTSPLKDDLPGENTSAAKCKLCLNTRANRTHVVREMMFGTKDEFHYLECSACGCLQLLDPPTSMDKYYPGAYYSLRAAVEPRSSLFSPRSVLKTLRNRAYLMDSPVVTSALYRVIPNHQFRAFAAAKPSRDSRILDVGCGEGDFLKDITALGFKHALGIDPFLRQSIRYPNGLEIRKCDLDDLAGTTWDLIMFHHSFEHIPDPQATLQAVATLLSERGCCLIRTPVPAWAWRNYGVDWVELDAPRHFFLHTKRSLSLLAERVGLRVTRIDYDSDALQFWGSELYRRSIPLSAAQQGNPRGFFSAEELKHFRDKAKKLNDCGEGGRAAFYLAKS